MSHPIHLLICEDSDDDALLIVRRLRRDGLELSYHRVETRAEAAAALQERRPDVVISDVNMPAFSAEEALQLLRQAGLDVPFILVSGQVGEESAAALLRAGAHDFVLKDRLARLAPAVQRELREAEGRQQRRAAEEALRGSEQRFRLLAEHAQDIIFRFRVHPEAEVEYLSPATALILGRPAAQLVGDPEELFSLVDPGDRSRIEGSWRSADPAPLAVRWRRPDGTAVWTEQRAIGVRDGSGRLLAVEGILRDITEQVSAREQREQLERQLRQAERLEAVGQLAGGVAHDFNNLLGVIMASADVAAYDLPEDHPIQAELASIERAAERGAALTRQLLVFSRSEPPQLETLDLNAVVGDTEQLLRRTIGEDLDFVTRLTDDRPLVCMDRTRLEQILVNLVVNARGAMPDGGQLTITTAIVVDETQCPVRLSVADTGCGMTPEVIQRAFEPFFTTKGPGKGTGLGLSTVYGAVTEAGGEITIDSTPGVGTTVRVLLPRAEPSRDEQETPPHRPPDRGRDETVLVVEDAEDLLLLVQRILTQAGYCVVDTSSPAEALRIASERPIDLVLTDVIMPDMSGPELAAGLQARDPALPILFMSGYSAGSWPGGGTLPPDTQLIHKPFTRQTLLSQVREALDAAQSSPPGSLPSRATIHP
ncbi:response regulator [Cryptosporangium minutisporangium]|uniref:histidine kinase n=1 Tax=Cryptosporangium minutisporangium TaxID=113569 RepID=A0ABP6SRX7_9ACTN